MESASRETHGESIDVRRPVGAYSSPDEGAPGFKSRNHPIAKSQNSYAAGLNSLISQNSAAATAADAGIVKIHAQTIFPATPQRTADNLCVAPTPTIAPVIV